MKLSDLSGTPDAVLVCFDTRSLEPVYTPYPARPAAGKKWVKFTCTGCNSRQKALMCSKQLAERERRLMRIKAVGYRVLGCAEILTAGLLYVTGYWPFATLLIVAAFMILRGSDKIYADLLIHEGIHQTDYDEPTHKDWLDHHRIYVRRFR